MVGVDHLGIFMLLGSQGNEKTDNTDALFTTIHRIQLRNDVPVYYDSDTLTDQRMMYFLGGATQASDSQLSFQELVTFTYGEPMYSSGLREVLYEEIFNDLLSMTSFANEYNSVAQGGNTPLDSIVKTIHTLLEVKKIDESIQTSWVSPDIQTDYLKAMTDDQFNGYTFVQMSRHRSSCEGLRFPTGSMPQ